MGNCPSCGAELGFGIVICPNCGSQIAGDSHTDGGHHGDDLTDTSGSGVEPSQGTGVTGEGGVSGPDAAGPEQLADGWVTDEVTPDLPPTMDAGVPGSEIPESHGGGFQQRPPGDDTPGPDHIINPPEVDSSVPGSDIPPSHGGGFQQTGPGDDGPGPDHITSPPQVDRPPADIPQRPDDGISVDDSGRKVPPRGWVGIAAILLIVIIALAGWYIWSGGDDGDGDGNGNGADPYDGLHIYAEGTSGSYPYEPPGEYHITVALRNNGSAPADLTGHDISVTVRKDGSVEGQEVQGLSGSLGAGETRTYDLVVETGILGGDDKLTVSVTLQKDGGSTKIHTISYDQTL